MHLPVAMGGSWPQHSQGDLNEGRSAGAKFPSLFPSPAPSLFSSSTPSVSSSASSPSPRYQLADGWEASGGASSPSTPRPTPRACACGFSRSLLMLFVHLQQPRGT